MCVCVCREVTPEKKAHLGHRVVINVNDLVQVPDDDFSDGCQLIEVVRPLRGDVHVESNGCQVTHCNLIRGNNTSNSFAVFLKTSHGYEVSPTHLIFAGVLYNLCAQIAGFDGAQVLLVALLVAGVLVEHVGCASFCLRLDDGVPQLLGLHHAFSSALLLVSEDGQETADISSESESSCERRWRAGLTECRAPQTPHPNNLLTQDTHWDTSETSPTNNNTKRQIDQNL